MSITSDIRSYADTAVNQGKQVTEQAGDYVGKYTASARDNVQDIAGKAGDAANDLRATAEKAVNLDAIKSAIEPYVTQAKEYGRSVTDRAEGLVSDITNDKRVAKLLDTASSVSDVVVETVQQRVVKPVQSLTGLGTKQAPARKPSPTKAAKQATTRPSTRPSTKPVDKPATKSTARKAPAKRAPKA